MDMADRILRGERVLVYARAVQRASEHYGALSIYMKELSTGVLKLTS